LIFPLIDLFDPSSLQAFIAHRRNRAKFWGPWSFRLRFWSSFTVTSSTQCRPFSIPQWARTTSPNRPADSAVLNRYAGVFRVNRALPPKFELFEQYDRTGGDLTVNPDYVQDLNVGMLGHSYRCQKVVVLPEVAEEGTQYTDAEG
jgi:hypothetical protein